MTDELAIRPLANRVAAAAADRDWGSFRSVLPLLRNAGRGTDYQATIDELAELLRRANDPTLWEDANHLSQSEQEQLLERARVVERRVLSGTEPAMQRELAELRRQVEAARESSTRRIPSWAGLVK